MNARRKTGAVIATAAALILMSMPSAWGAPKISSGSGGWSAAQSISGITQPDPTRGSQLDAVAVNASGLTLAAWDQFTYTGSGGGTIGAAVQSAGRWGTPFTVSGPTGFSSTPRVAVAADGSMAVSWIYQDPATVADPQQKVQVAVRPRGATGWATTTLATAPIGGVALITAVPLGFDAGGNLTAAWSQWDGVKHVVQTATRMTGSGWSAPTTLSGNADGLYMDLAVNGRGDAAVVFSLSPYTNWATGTNAQFVSRSGANGTWSAPTTISETMPSSTGYITGPQVALDSAGLATVIYMGSGLEATRELVTGSWTTPGSVITSPVNGASFMSPDLGLDVNGNAVVAVAIFDPTINVDRSSVWVARGTSAGSWTKAVRLTDPSVPIDAYATRVAVSPDGNLALVGWIDHYHGTVQASRFANGAWGSPSMIGRGTAYASFQEVMGLDAASSTVAAVVWKSTKSGTQTMASSYRG